MSARVPVRFLIIAAAVAVPSAAWACPNCAVDGGPSSRLWVVIGMLVMPFLLALLITPILRRALRSKDEEESS